MTTGIKTERETRRSRYTLRNMHVGKQAGLHGNTETQSYMEIQGRAQYRVLGRSPISMCWSTK